MGDLQLVRSSDPNGRPLYDLSVTPSGDWATVSGLDSLAQNVLLFLDTALGSHPTDPLFGTTLSALIGQPYTDASAYQLAVAECEAYFLAQAAATPHAPLDEQMDHIGEVQVTLVSGQIGNVLLTFTVFARSGTSAVVTTQS